MRLLALAALVAVAAPPVAARAQDELDLAVGDPARRDQRVAVMMDAIVDSRTAAVLAPDDLPERLADVRLLLMGESHTEMASHRVQLAVIRALVESGREVMIGLEMYPYTEQQHLDHWIDGLLTEKGFVQLSRWYENWGYNWGYYREIFAYARDHDVRMVAVNTPREVVSAVRQKGFDGLSEEEAQHIPPRVDTDNEEHLELFRAYMGPPGSGHGVSDDALFSMFQAQCTWDAAMAYNSVKALEQRPGAIMVVMVGSGHVAYGLGIQRQAKLWFDGEVRTLIPVALGADPHHPRDSVQASYADYVWGVPAETDTAFPSLDFSTRQTDGQVEVIIVPSGSDAAEAGVSVGDRIVAIDGEPVPDRETMSRLVAEKRWGDRIVLGLEREGRSVEAAFVFRRR
ncbi:MAG: ChaN family lipoprotein [Acidobacteriota bacterium]